MIGRIRIRRDTSSNWYQYDPVLLQGELGLESDTDRVKVGNGGSWNTTPYFNELSSLKDLNLTNLSDGSVLVYNNTSKTWNAQTINITGIASPVNPVAGDILIHNGTDWTKLSKGSEGQGIIVKDGTVQYGQVGSNLTEVDGNTIVVKSNTLNTTLNAGEIGLDLEKKIMKFGTGSNTSWNSCPYIKFSDDKVIGVAWNTASASPKLERIDEYGDKISVNVNSFNEHGLWGNIARCMLSASGTPTFGSNARGDDLTLTSPNIMVNIPQTHYNMWQDGDYLMWAASDASFENSQIHPAFRQRGGVDRNNIYVGAYESHDAGSSKLGSASGKTVLTNQTMATFETRANNIGSGWGTCNFWTRSLINMLFYIEFANLNSQDTIAPGNVNNTAALLTGANSANTNINTYGTGTGNGVSGKSPVVYRGMENLWGNVAEFIIGFNSTNSTYRTAKRDGTSIMADILTTYDTSTVSPLVSSAITGDFTRNVGFDSVLSGSFVPEKIGGSTSTFMCDEIYYHNSANAAGINIIGGAWNGISSIGINSLSFTNSNSMTGNWISSRLEYIPQV